MFDLDREVTGWCKRTYRWPQYRKSEVVELEDHLHCAVAKWIEQGLTSEDAFERAVAELGEAESIRAEYRKNWGRVSTVSRRFERRPIQIVSICAIATVCLGLILASRDVESLQSTRSLLVAICTMPFKFFGAI
jgi:hypothetical protein